MSKFSSRYKRSSPKEKKEKTGLTGPALVEQGKAAFKRGNYDQAIQAWEQARTKKDVPAHLPEALAEAYFRRAIGNNKLVIPSFTDLRQAIQLQPADLRYRYHLALAQHHAGFLAEAEDGYRQLLAESPPFERATEPLAQLLVEKKKLLYKDPVWTDLGEETKQWLEVAEAISRKKAPSTLARLAEDDNLAPIWRALALLAAGNRAEAKPLLQAALEAENQLSGPARAVVHYYLGLLAVDEQRLDQALTHWQTARADGFNTPHLRRNLAVLLEQQALAEWQAGRPEQALELFEQFGDLRGTRVKQSELYRQLHLEVGYAAAQRNDWEKALYHWEEVERTGDNSRPLLMNLALAYQHTNNHYEAAERWRELLRRRPRKADHPEALTEDQVARMWQNVAENYSKAGDYEEAVKTYRNALKWAPDNINLRLKLVEALQTDGRWQAAVNELERTMEQEPDHVPTLIMLAEMYGEDYWSYRRAHHLWNRVLELEPQNPIARQQLAYLYEKEGTFSAQWGDLRQAIKIYQDGLAVVPDSQRLHVVIGGAYVDLKEFDQARHYFEQALRLNPNDLQTLYMIFLIWLEHESEPDLVQVVDRIKAVKGSVPDLFFLDLIDRCLERDQLEFAQSLLEYTESEYADSEEMMLELAMRYAQANQENKAVALLRQIIKVNPDHTQAHLRLGSIYYKLGQTRLAQRHWDKAESQARKENNQMALYELKMNKDFLVYGKRPPRNPLEMLQSMPPELRKQMLEQLPPEVAHILQDLDPDMLDAMLDLGFDDEDDDEWDYDDIY